MIYCDIVRISPRSERNYIALHVGFVLTLTTDCMGDDEAQEVVLQALEYRPIGDIGRRN
jgi:uncharacterized protein HemY